MLAAPVWMAQFRKSGASFSTSQPCRAACIHGIWNILFSCRQRTCKTCHKPRHTQNALHLCTQSHLHGKINTSQTIESCSRQVKTMLQKDKFKQPQSQYLVDPFEPRYFTRVYLLFQPWSHTHSLHRHAGLEKEREKERSGMCQSLTATFPPSTGCSFSYEYPGSTMTNFNPTSKNKHPAEVI